MTTITSSVLVLSVALSLRERLSLLTRINKRQYAFLFIKIYPYRIDHMEESENHVAPTPKPA